MEPLRHVRVHLVDRSGAPLVIPLDEVIESTTPGVVLHSDLVPFPDWQLVAKELGHSFSERLAGERASRHGNQAPGSLQDGRIDFDHWFAETFRGLSLDEWNLFIPPGPAVVALYRDGALRVEEPVPPEVTEITIRTERPRILTGGFQLQVVRAVTQNPMPRYKFLLEPIDRRGRYDFEVRGIQGTGRLRVERYPTGTYRWRIPWQESDRVASCMAAWGTLTIQEGQTTNLGTIQVVHPQTANPGHRRRWRAYRRSPGPYLPPRPRLPPTRLDQRTHLPDPTSRHHPHAPRKKRPIRIELKAPGYQETHQDLTVNPGPGSPQNCQVQLARSTKPLEPTK